LPTRASHAHLTLAINHHGRFSGDDGFIRLQAALLEHATDDQIMYQVSTGTMAVFQRAGITMPGQ